MNEFNGIILYNIQRDGNLSGVYTNIPSRGRINLEILTRMPNINSNNNFEIIGEYQSMYFQGEERFADVWCLITREVGENIFRFLWRQNDIVIFEGIGYQMNNNQIAVNYWINNNE